MATIKKSLKAVDSSKKPGLAKLPTEVRNKMGYAQNGIVSKIKASFKKAGEDLEQANRDYKTSDSVRNLPIKSKSMKGKLDEMRSNRAKADSLFKVAQKREAGGMKSGGMLKRADGSYSKRGLWDNIRANKGSGKKPTAQMLKQEKKIKAKTK